MELPARAARWMGRDRQSLVECCSSAPVTASGVACRGMCCWRFPLTGNRSWNGAKPEAAWEKAHGRIPELLLCRWLRWRRYAGLRRARKHPYQTRRADLGVHGMLVPPKPPFFPGHGDPTAIFGQVRGVGMVGLNVLVRGPLDARAL